jgi:DNA topoisomerase-1
VHGSAIRLRFRGKSGIVHEAEVDDPRIARIVRRCRQLPGQELFQYVGEDGAPRSVSSTDVNDYLRGVAGEDFTAKDFRTWHGTVQALELTRLACSENAAAASVRYGAKEILGAVARQLGNTPAVCKKAYVHPAVLALGNQLSSDAEAIAAIWQRLAGTRATRRLHAAEARLLTFLRQQRRVQGRRDKRTVSRSIATR